MTKVLIAEDNVMLADILEFFLEAGGYEVCGVARTVEEAVELADLHKPDLGVFDCRLAEGGSGMDIQGRMKDRESFGVLYATGDELSPELKEADGVAYLRKPYSRKDILEGLKIVSDITAGRSPTQAIPVNFHLLENEKRVAR